MDSTSSLFQIDPMILTQFFSRPLNDRSILDSQESSSMPPLIQTLAQARERRLRTKTFNDIPQPSVLGQYAY